MQLILPRTLVPLACSLWCSLIPQQALSQPSSPKDGFFPSNFATAEIAARGPAGRSKIKRRAAVPPASKPGPKKKARLEQPDSWDLGKLSPAELERISKSQTVKKPPAPKREAPSRNSELGSLRAKLSAYKNIIESETRKISGDSRAQLGRTMVAPSRPQPQAQQAAPESSAATLYTPPAMEPAPAKLSLVVSGADKDHFLQNLETLLRVHQRQHVPVGEVLVVVEDANMRSMLTGSELFVNEEFYKLLNAFEQSMGKEKLRVRPVLRVPRRLGAQQSPIWVVQDQRGDHVFEGHTNPGVFFSEHGAFIER